MFKFEIVEKHKHNNERFINYYIDFLWKKNVKEECITMGGLTYFKMYYHRNQPKVYVWLSEERRDKFYFKKAEIDCINRYLKLVATNGDY